MVQILRQIVLKGFTIATGIAALTVGIPLSATEIINNDADILLTSEWQIPSEAGYTYGTLYIGDVTSGTLTISTNGKLFASLIHVGKNSGTVIGTLNLINSGTVYVQSGSFSYPFVIGGDGSSGNLYQGAEGHVTIDGADSQILVDTGVSGEIAIGSNGAKGYLTIQNGGVFLANRNNGLYIGSRGDKSSQGFVVVDGVGSTLSAATRILVGTYNEGRLTIQNGGLVEAGTYISIGRTTSTVVDDSVMTVTGAGSIAQASQNVFIGDNGGRGTLILSEGGLVSTDIIDIAVTRPSIGELIIGDYAGNSAVAPGVIQANQIRFRAGTGRITLNHTNNNYVLSLQLSGNGTLHAIAGTTWLTEDNSGFSGTTQLAGGTLGAGHNNALGTSAVTVTGAATLAYGDLVVLNNAISINDAVTLRGQVDTGNKATQSGTFSGNASAVFEKTGSGVLEVTSANQSTYLGTIKVTEGILQTAAISSLNHAASEISIDTQATLALIKPVAAPEVIQQRLTGQGLLTVNLGGTDEFLSFNPVTNHGHFSGTVALDQGQLILNSDHESALRNATMVLENQGTITVPAGTPRTLKSLVMKGGMLIFKATETIPGAHAGQLSNVLTLQQTLDISGGGTLQVESLNRVDPVDISTASLNAPLLDQQQLVDTSGSKLVEIGLVNAAAINGNVTDIILVDRDGGALAGNSQQVLDIIQDGVVKAQGTYDFAVGSYPTELFIGYGLTEIDLHTQGANALVLSTSGAIQKTFQAKITGTGDLTLDAGNDLDALQLANANNDYTGRTLLQSGTLRLGTNHALGATHELYMVNGTHFDLNGYTQVLQVINTEIGSELNIHGGQLTINKGGTIVGTMSGIAGGLVIQGPDPLQIHSENPGLAVNVAIAAGATASLTRATGLGTSRIGLDGLLWLDHAEGIFANSVDGQGTLAFTGSKLELSGNNQAFQGQMLIDADSVLKATSALNLGQSTLDNQGALVLAVAHNDLWVLNNLISGTGTMTKEGPGQLTIPHEQAYTGVTTIAEGTLILGPQGALSSSMVDVLPQGAMGGYGRIVGTVNHAGILFMGALEHADSFGTLTIQGDYQGLGGLLIFDTALGGDSSPTDHLIIEGNTWGTGRIQVNNIHGAGAETIQGIELIGVKGQSNAVFSLEGRAVAGAYEYELKQGQDGAWYLRSEKNATISPEILWMPVFLQLEALYRPEAGSYLANTALSNTLFSHKLYDRNATLEDYFNQHFWGRVAGTWGKFRDSSGQLKTRTQSQMIQLGHDLWVRRLSNRGVLKTGLMFGYGHTYSKTHGVRQDSRSTSRSDGYALGLYGTWFQNADQPSGLYLDIWLQYAHFDHTVKGRYLQRESYSAAGFMGSVETGYTVKLTENLFIQPQAQITWSGIRAGDHREYNGTQIKSARQGMLQSRVGIHVFGVWVPAHGIELRPYVALNWLHNSKDYSVDMDEMRLYQRGARNIGQLKFGMNSQITPALNISADVLYAQGDKHYQNAQLTLQVKYRF